jgi:hypothetical protein
MLRSRALGVKVVTPHHATGHPADVPCCGPPARRPFFYPASCGFIPPSKSTAIDCSRRGAPRGLLQQYAFCCNKKIYHIWHRARLKLPLSTMSDLVCTICAAAASAPPCRLELGMSGFLSAEDAALCAFRLRSSNSNPITCSGAPSARVLLVRAHLLVAYCN